MTKLLLDFKEITLNEVIEVKAWKIGKSKDYPEGINYRMAYIKNGKRVLGYDNNTSEGHHKHHLETKSNIQFVSLESLFSQFMNEIKKIRSGGENANQDKDSKC